MILVLLNSNIILNFLNLNCKLINLIDHACLTTQDGYAINRSNIDKLLHKQSSHGHGQKTAVNPFYNIDDLRSACEGFEKEIILTRLQQFNGNRRLAAESLNLPRLTLANRCKKIGIG